jgi:hypothetical protein
MAERDGQPVTPRTEFRVFGDDTVDAWDDLARVGTPEGHPEARTDTYLVVPGRVDASLKLRGDSLELKTLRGSADGLETWEPAGEVGFPIDPETLEAAFLRPAGVRLDLPATAIDRARFLALAHAAPDVRVVEVAKRRRRFRLHGATAELAGIRVEGRPDRSVAVEDADPGVVSRAIAAIGLAGRRNVSYQRFLVGELFPASRPEA